MTKPGSADSSSRAPGSRTTADDPYTKLKAAIERGQRQKETALELATTVMHTLAVVLDALSGSEQQRTELELVISSLEEELASQRDGQLPDAEEVAQMSDVRDRISAKEVVKEPVNTGWTILWTVVLVVLVLILGKYFPVIQHPVGKYIVLLTTLAFAGAAWINLGKLLAAVESGLTQLHYGEVKNKELDKYLTSEEVKELNILQPAPKRWELRPVPTSKLKIEDLHVPVKKALAAKREATTELKRLNKRLEQKAEAQSNCNQATEDLDDKEIELEDLVEEIGTDIPTPEQATKKAELEAAVTECKKVQDEKAEALRKANELAKKAEKDRDQKIGPASQTKEVVQELVSRLRNQNESKWQLGFTPNLVKTIRAIATFGILWFGLQVPTALVHTLEDRGHTTLSSIVSMVAPDTTRARVTRRQLKIEVNDPRRAHANEQGEVTLFTLHLPGDSGPHFIVDVEREKKEEGK